MKKIHIALLLGVLIVAAGWALVVQSQTPPNSVHVYYFVAPSLLPNGSSSDLEIADLKVFLAKTAGGYTHLGESDGGFYSDAGEVVTETNHSFIVSSPQDISNSLRDYLSEHFSVEYPFIITWDASTVDQYAAVQMWSAKK